jgi:hypothetical protein
MPMMAMATESPISVHSSEVFWGPSLTATSAAEANAGASQCSKPRQLSPKMVHAFGTPSQPASTLPRARSESGTVMEAGDSWM